MKDLSVELGRVPRIDEAQAMMPRVNLVILFGSYDSLLRAAGLIEKDPEPKAKFREPKIGVLDIETKPIKAWVWKVWDTNVENKMIIEDWSVLSWAWKWIGSPDVFYQDLSENTDYTKDELIIRGVWELLNECDVVITQNGKKFDIKKLNTKFEEYGLPPPKTYRHIDTLQIKKKNFGLTSNKLEFSTNKFNSKYKKLKHEEFSGNDLWLECLKGNKRAWEVFKEYNIHDVLATEELYINTLMKWDNTINWAVYTGIANSCPNCGNDEIDEIDIVYTKIGAFQQYRCKRCGSLSTSKNNELDKKTRKGLLK